jgi:hypothetical protein
MVKKGCPTNYIYDPLTGKCRGLNRTGQIFYKNIELTKILKGPVKTGKHGVFVTLPGGKQKFISNKKLSVKLKGAITLGAYGVFVKRK